MNYILDKITYIIIFLMNNHYPFFYEKTKGFRANSSEVLKIFINIKKRSNYMLAVNLQ